MSALHSRLNSIQIVGYNRLPWRLALARIKQQLPAETDPDRRVALEAERRRLQTHDYACRAQFRHEAVLDYLTDLGNRLALGNPDDVAAAAQVGWAATVESVRTTRRRAGQNRRTRAHRRRVYEARERAEAIEQGRDPDDAVAEYRAVMDDPTRLRPPPEKRPRLGFNGYACARPQLTFAEQVRQRRAVREALGRAEDTPTQAPTLVTVVRSAGRVYYRRKPRELLRHRPNQCAGCHGCEPHLYGRDGRRRDALSSARYVAVLKSRVPPELLAELSPPPPQLPPPPPPA